MAIPKFKKENVIEALKYIDENGVPAQNKSTRYDLVGDDGHRYPPKYVVAVADYLANGTTISTDGFNAVEAKTYLAGLGFTIDIKQQVQFELTITAESVESTDERFTMDNLTLGDNYEPLGVYFKKVNGEVINRTNSKGERRISNQTMPRLACQIFERQLASLSVEEKKEFKVCRYKPSREMICGIFSSKEEYNKYRKSREILAYDCSDGSQFVIYCWNIFSTIIFVQECLRMFGNPGDCFILKYCEKDGKETEVIDEDDEESQIINQQPKGYQNKYSTMLIESKNLIFRGAPGTGKSYLAKEIAADIISNGEHDDYTLLTDEQKKQLEFVQFHPSYDYTDFVEGLRPKRNEDGSMGFELQDGIFKKFVARARKNYENSQKNIETVEKELSVQEAMEEFFEGIEQGDVAFKTKSGNTFYISGVDETHINILMPENATSKKLSLSLEEVRKMLEADVWFDKVKDVSKFFNRPFATQGDSYLFVIYNAIREKKNAVSKIKAKQEELKKYIFIIDEINRGEISKIFGELFFSIDPGYRGRVGEISTQYSNLHSNPDEKFYIPENVYIIGTMNDIDRSVDSFDFAMRRRFRFVEIRAEEGQKMLGLLENEKKRTDAIKKMDALNKEIAAVEDLNENYQIGASYFLKLKTLDFEQLWTDYLQPLLREYIHGMHDEDGIMMRFEAAYNKNEPLSDDVNEIAQD